MFSEYLCPVYATGIVFQCQYFSNSDSKYDVGIFIIPSGRVGRAAQVGPRCLLTAFKSLSKKTKAGSNCWYIVKLLIDGQLEGQIGLIRKQGTEFSM